ncbi:hypothetical protein PHSY_002273 [Pseudozyma hubeiensis SY62]|uniref:Secreted protein n=1 Tax=Pseudozyma hubeiensis (strain SY62) TaxID=1305764 RepID=R9P9C8_PSEHS|nr:hypothetical protein PHSY_002273 [Pseudozyma hubeiensis SY62]GAC94700.1 hypothetical protein PHSY_002273 [Pseudozyma hubeiensis SY62]
MMTFLCLLQMMIFPWKIIIYCQHAQRNSGLYKRVNRSSTRSTLVSEYRLYSVARNEKQMLVYDHNVRRIKREHRETLIFVQKEVRTVTTWTRCGNLHDTRFKQNLSLCIRVHFLLFQATFCRIGRWTFVTFERTILPRRQLEGETFGSHRFKTEEMNQKPRRKIGKIADRRTAPQPHPQVGFLAHSKPVLQICFDRFAQDLPSKRSTDAVSSLNTIDPLDAAMYHKPHANVERTCESA